MEVRIQISMFVRNAPGTLSDICSYLSDHEINIVGISVQDAVDHAVVRMVTDKPRAASYLLEDRVLLVIDSPVLCLDLRNIPGKLAKVASTLKEHGLNIHYLYGGLDTEARAARIYMRVDDPERARKVLTD